MIKAAAPQPESTPSFTPGKRNTNPAAASAFLIEEVADAAEVARCRAQHERARGNTEWLEAHWSDLLPQARGRFLAVAGREAFLADTPDAAWAWVEARHPEDDGAFVQYLRPQRGPRIYESFRQVVFVR